MDLKLPLFEPYFPFATGHTQTLLGHLVPSPAVSFLIQKEILTLPDGDQLLLEYADQKSAYTVSLFHGLAGDTGSDYIRRSALVAHSQGWNVLMVNHRGVRDVFSKKTYHSGRGEDIGFVLKWSRRKFAGSLQLCAGFSMSGSILLNLLTGRSGSEQPDCAVVVNAPLNLKTSAQLLTKGFSKIYDLRFYLRLKKMIRQRGGNFALPYLGNTMDIDELYTAPVNGFRNAADYYEQCSTYKYLSQIKVPTFVLSTYDDPFIDVQDYLQADWSESTQVRLLQAGGHIGYFSKMKDPMYGHRWLDCYMESVLKRVRASS